jgi:hypothetical protein
VRNDKQSPVLTIPGQPHPRYEGSQKLADERKSP